MKLSVKLPMLIGAAILATSMGIGLVAVQISSVRLENSILDGVGETNELNAKLLSIQLNGRLDVLYEIANTAMIRTMDWEIVRGYLTPNVSRIGVLDLALIGPDGIAHYVLEGNTLDLGDRDYVKQAMAGEKSLDIVVSRQTGNVVVMFAVPIHANNLPNAPVLGVLIARTDGALVISGMVANLRSNMETGYSFMADTEGTIIAHRNTELVRRRFNPIIEARTNPELQSFGNMVAAALRQEGDGIARYTFENTARLGHYDTIPGYPFLLFSSVERSEIDRQLSEMRFYVLFIGLLLIIAGLIAAIFLGNSIARPIIRIAAILENVGKGDLTQRIDVSSKDEIGSLSRNINNTLENIQDLVVGIKTEAGTLSDVGQDLSTEMSKTAAAMNEIASNIQSIKSRVINQSASVNETNATMEQVVENVNKLSGYIEVQSTHISQASSAVEQMVANTHSVNDTLSKNVNSVMVLAEASEVGRSGLQDVATDIQGIARESEGLMEINSVMENIASQTNLLSMNAAIEAAHAGEAGKGFAVVADEIRKLAENSSEQSKTIGMVLKKIKDSIDTITRSTENVLDKFQSIDTSIKTVVEQEKNIRNAMKEQGIGGKQTLDGVSHMVNITRQVEAGSQEMSAGAKEVIRESSNLEKMTEEIALGMNEMATGVQQVNEAVNHVNAISGKNREGIDVLMREVSRFKVE